MSRFVIDMSPFKVLRFEESNEGAMEMLEAVRELDVARVVQGGGVMKASELRKIMNDLDPRFDDAEVEIPIRTEERLVGATPTVGVKNAGMGFDWDSGKFMILTDEEVMKKSEVEKGGST